MQGFFGTETARRVDLQHARDHVLGGLRDFAPVPIVELVISSNDELRQLIRRSLKRRVTAQQDVGDNTDGPHIAHLAVPLHLTIEDLGGDVLRRSTECTQGIDSAHLLRETEIGNLDAHVVVGSHEQKIFGLDITMGDMLLVAVVNGLEQSLAHASSFTFGVDLLINDTGEQVASLHFFHDHEAMILLHEYIEQSNDVRSTTQHLQCRNFILQRRFTTVLQTRQYDFLDGVRLRGAFVRALVHECVSSLSQLGTNLVKLIKRLAGETVLNEALLVLLLHLLADGLVLALFRVLLERVVQVFDSVRRDERIHRLLHLVLAFDEELELLPVDLSLFRNFVTVLDPARSQRAGCGNSLLRIVGQHPNDEVLGALADTLPKFVREAELAVPCLLEDDIVILIVKR
mmetsp:Transcript_11380/g.32665  ORF Transcript_11380/g.32665 Transcript_11380/m.32665 type:complete len:401 (+) Transcript_11380:1273-2475(+)